jgi:hypothetical protein
MSYAEVCVSCLRRLINEVISLKSRVKELEERQKVS